jgi:hypothetical protein
LRQACYDLKETPNPLVVMVTKASELNRLIQYVPQPGIISVRTPFVMNTGGYGVKKEIMHEVEAANRDSWMDTFYVDNDGDVWTSSYIFITDHITGADVIRFLNLDAVGAIGELQKSGLAKHWK